jgi:hypothetical protein
MEQFDACDEVYTFLFSIKRRGGQWDFAESMIQMLGVYHIFV